MQALLFSAQLNFQPVIGYPLTMRSTTPSRTPFTLATCSVFLFVLLIGAFATPHPILAENPQPADSDCFFTQWPHQTSDLKPDPRLVFRQLDNGFRYVLLQNKEPKDRVILNLLVGTGSLYENENERGLSHFLEHMMFNGSTHYPSGKLVEYFQSIGMNFGGDLNAYTSYDETVYKIILPDSSTERLRDGLTVLSDFARNALLQPEEVDRERGVILSEKRSRDSASYRFMTEHSLKAFAGSRLADRQPIGTDEVLNQVNAPLLRHYYDTWYRPDNMILVAVGDFQPSDITQLIAEQFSPLASPLAKHQCPDTGKLLEVQGTKAFYFQDQELGSLSVSIESFWNISRENDSLAFEKEQLLKILSSRIMQYRLQKIEEQEHPPFAAAGYSAGTVADRIGFGIISARCIDGKWQEALSALQKNLNQALQYGVLDSEVDRVKNEVLAELDAAVATMHTKESSKIATDLIGDLSSNRVSQSPLQEQELFTPIVTSLTAAEINEALRATWKQQMRLISLAGNASLDQKIAEQLIISEYQKNETRPVDSLTAQNLSSFPYLPDPVAVAPVKTELRKDIDSEDLYFANGIVAHLKHTDFEDNSLKIRIDFGSGKKSEPKPGLAILAEKVVGASGTGRLKISEIAEILSGKSIQTSFKIGDESCVLEGSSLVKDSTVLFQLLHTMLNDAGFRQEGYDRAMQGFDQMYKQIDHDVHGTFSLSVLPFLAGNNPRFGLPPYSTLKTLQLSDVKDWLQPQFSSGPMEVTLVGQFDNEAIRLQLAQYFGSLGNRTQDEAATDSPQFPSGKELRIQIDSEIEKALVTVAWPTADYWDIHQTRRLQILTSIVQDRLRDAIREKLGATYSPSVYHSGSKVYPGFGMMVAQVTVDPGRIEEVEKAIEQTVLQLTENGIDTDMLLRAKEPTLTSIKEAVRTNAYWLYSVLALSARHPQQQQWPATILNDYMAITTEDISRLATTYLRPERAAKAIITPAKQQSSH